MMKQQVIENRQSHKSITQSKYKILEIDDQWDQHTNTAQISNNLKYIVSGGSEKLLKVWDYQTTKLIKSIKFDQVIWNCRFTDDSQLLYVAIQNILYQFYVNNKFKKLCKLSNQAQYIYNIYCISNSIILTAASDSRITKTDVNKKIQLLKIYAHFSGLIRGLDYNKDLNIIASGSDDQSIKLWNGKNGALMIQKLQAHGQHKQISQILFILNNNQLISLDVFKNVIIWNINYPEKQLEKLLKIEDTGFNISLVLEQQYLIATDSKCIKVYSIEGQFVRQFKIKDGHLSINNYQFQINLVFFFNTIQLDSMKAILIQGIFKLQVCKVELN